MLLIYKRFLLVLLSITIFSSCTKESEENFPTENITYLPSLKETKEADVKVISDIQNVLNKHQGSITTNSINDINNYDVSNSIIAQYEGYENVEFVYVPNLSNVNQFEVLIIKDGQIIPDFKLSITNNDNSLQI